MTVAVDKNFYLHQILKAGTLIGTFFKLVRALVPNPHGTTYMYSNLYLLNSIAVSYHLEPFFVSATLEVFPHLLTHARKFQPPGGTWQGGVPSYPWGWLQGLKVQGYCM